jgi:hypothetical protein
MLCWICSLDLRSLHFDLFLNPPFSQKKRKRKRKKKEDLFLNPDLPKALLITDLIELYTLPVFENICSCKAATQV